MARNNRNTDRFSGANHFKFTAVPAQWMLFTDGKSSRSFFYGPILLAGPNPHLPMKKPTPQSTPPENISPLLDEETRLSIRNLLFGPKVLARLKALTWLARDTKASSAQSTAADDERLAA